MKTILLSIKIKMFLIVDIVKPRHSNLIKPTLGLLFSDSWHGLIGFFPMIIRQILFLISTFPLEPNFRYISTGTCLKELLFLSRHCYWLILIFITWWTIKWNLRFYITIYYEWGGLFYLGGLDETWFVWGYPLEFYAVFCWVVGAFWIWGVLGFRVLVILGLFHLVRLVLIFVWADAHEGHLRC